MTVPMKMSAILAYMNLADPWLPGAELYCTRTAVIDCLVADMNNKDLGEQQMFETLVG